MERKQYYTSGQFAKKANVSVRTIRYYDQQELLIAEDSDLSVSGIFFGRDSGSDPGG